MSNRPSRKPSASAKVRRASSSGSARSTLWLWIGLVVLVVVVGGVAVAVSRSKSDSNTAAGGTASPSGGTVVPAGDVDYGTVTVDGAALTAASATDPSPATGATLPTVTGETFDGSTVTIAPDGKPQIIMGIAHWCPHCQAEVPRIQDWLDTNGMPADVNIVAVATANDASRGNFPAGTWLRDVKWSVPTMVDDDQSAAGQALGVGSFPYFLVVGADGKVIQQTSGEITMDQWQALLDAARTGTAAT